MSKKIILLFIILILFFPFKYKRQQESFLTNFYSDVGIECNGYQTNIKSLSLSIFFRQSKRCDTVENLKLDSLTITFGSPIKRYEYPHITFSTGTAKPPNSWLLLFKWFYNENFTPLIGLRHRLGVNLRFMLEDKTDWDNIFFTYGCPEHPSMIAMSTSCDIELDFDFPVLTMRQFDENDILQETTYEIFGD